MMPRLSLVEAGVKGVEVFGVEHILNHSLCFAEALEVDNLAFTQELDGVADVGVIGEAQDIIIGDSCFLLGGEVFAEVGEGVACALESCCRERHA